MIGDSLLIMFLLNSRFRYSCIVMSESFDSWHRRIENNLTVPSTLHEHTALVENLNYGIQAT